MDNEAGWWSWDLERRGSSNKWFAVASVKHGRKPLLRHNHVGVNAFLDRKVRVAKENLSSMQ